MEGEIGQQVVGFSSLFRRAAEDSYVALGELVERFKDAEQPDSEKKIELLKYILKTRQRMLRLHVLAKWCKQAPLVQYCQQLASTLSSHDTCFTQAADSLFFMHEGLQQARAPIYDVPSAIEVMLTGSYQKLPKCIEDLGLQNTLTEEEQEPVLKELDRLLRSKLLDMTLPKEISELIISDGTLLLRVNGEFEVLLTLGYRGHLSLWRILHLRMLVGEKNGPVKLEETRRYALGDDLERRMSAAENPFSVLYSILHEFAVALIMDTVIRQVQRLRQGRWRDAIKFELISDSSTLQSGNAGTVQVAQDGEPDLNFLKTPGLKIVYWLDSDRGTTVADPSFHSSIKIEPGADLQIKCFHSSFVLDPLSDTEAEFSLDNSCIDVEKLLLRVIACNRHTRLLEIYMELCKHSQICQAEGDVILLRQGTGHSSTTEKDETIFNTKEYWTDEVLQVRAYGPMYITLGINIRNGRFRLQSSKNVFEDSVLVDSEEALNQGTMTAAEVFINLRSRSILHLFASTGRFLGLKVYEQGSTNLKMPKSIVDGTDLLLLGFPQMGTSYFLMLQLDKDFKPIFRLLETQSESGAANENSYVIWSNKIDVSQMDMAEDELNLALLEWEKLTSVMSKKNGPTDFSENALILEKASEPILRLTGGSQSGFSSLVDEIFELEKSSSAPAPNQNHLRSFSANSHTNSNPGAKGYGSPKKEGLQYSHINNNMKNSSNSPTLNSSCYQPNNNTKAIYPNGPFNSFNQLKGSPETLSRSRSDQEISSVRSPYSGESGHGSSIDDEQTKVPVSRGRQLSPLRSSPLQSSVGNNKQNNLKSFGGSSYLTRNTCQALSVSEYNGDIVLKQDVNKKKRQLADILPLISSLPGSGVNWKKRRLLPPSQSCIVISRTHTPSHSNKKSKLSYADLLSESNHGLSPSNVFLTSLLHVFRRCSLCIKHAQLTGQMDALGIPYVEEVGLRTPSSNLWLRVPFAIDNSWQRICLCLGKPGSMSWDAKVNDPYFKELWALQKGSGNTIWGSSIRIANTSDIDSHIHYDPEGIVLSYKTVEADSIKKLLSDLRRLFNARFFVCGMRTLLNVKSDEVLDGGNTNTENKSHLGAKAAADCNEKISEQMRRAFKIEAVGLMSLWFQYGSMSVMAHFVVEWEAGKEGCTMHVFPDQLWPHTKFLEDFINGAEVASFLDCVRLTAGPLVALGTAIRPARMPATVASGSVLTAKQNSLVQSQGILPTSSASITNPSPSSCTGGSGGIASLGNHSIHNTTMLSAAGRGGPGIVPSSLLPIDVSVVLRGPYWIRIIYRKKFAVDMRCYAGDQVWLQPATPPKGGPVAGGSLPCPQFRPFIMEHVAQGLNAMEPNMVGNTHSSSVSGFGNISASMTAAQMPNGNRGSAAASRPVSVGGQGASRVGTAMLASSNLAAVASGLPIRISPGTGVPVHVKGELNTAFIGLGDDGGYGGGWVPLAALKKVLRGILKYLGVLWLFAQLPELLKDILGSILKENEGALLNLDQEQPALRFFVGGYVFAVSVHRVQLLLQVLSVKRFHHHQQQQQQQQTQSNNQEELVSTEISEICDYFSRRVASEPYDASRVASFITLLTLPISVLREFLKLIAWEKGMSHAQGVDAAPAQRPRVELCLENHSGTVDDDNVENPSAIKSSIHHDRAHNSVDFALTFVLDHALIPHVYAAGGAAWLPYCVSIRLKYSFGDSVHISLVRIDGSHGGSACWSRLEDWEKCRQRVARAVEFGVGNSGVDVSQGRLKVVAETLQRTLQGWLQQVRDAAASSMPVAT